MEDVLVGWMKSLGGLVDCGGAQVRSKIIFEMLIFVSESIMSVTVL